MKKMLPASNKNGRSCTGRWESMLTGLRVCSLWAILICAAAPESSTEAETTSLPTAWHSRDPHPTGTLLERAAAHGKTVVAVGQGTIVSTTNGVDWANRRVHIGATQLFDVCWAGDKFVAVGGVGTILTSEDGILWQRVASGVTNNLYRVIHGDGKTIVSSMFDGGSDAYLISEDALSWSKAEGLLRDAVFAKDRFFFPPPFCNELRWRELDGYRFA